MSYLRDITRLPSTTNILIEIDPVLLVALDSPDKVSTSRVISFSIFKLVYLIGVIQSKRFNPSNRLKWLDYFYLVEKIHNDSTAFRLRIDDIRRINGSETLKDVSENLGVGISAVVAEELFKIKRSTITRIYGQGQRPDWKCQTEDDRILVFESKGSISESNSRQQEISAIVQKTREPGDVKIASLTVLKEGVISTNRFVDPPIDKSNISPEMENHILRAGHYASVFNFLGSSKLSRYYSQMRKRLLGRITPFEQDVKDDVFRELQIDSPEVSFENKRFAGIFRKVEDGKYIFVGVDKRLLSYRGFIRFKDYENDINTVIDENHYNLFKDGVLIIEIENIGEFRNIVQIEAIPNVQDKITISDIDSMNEISFIKFFIHLLKENGFENIRQETRQNDFITDLAASYKDESYFFEFKINKEKGISKSQLQQLKLYNEKIEDGQIVLVTNTEFDRVTAGDSNLKVIDRDKLKRLSEYPGALIKILQAT